MGDPSRYPEIRTARHLYALRWLPREIRDDQMVRAAWTVYRTVHVSGMTCAQDGGTSLLASILRNRCALPKRCLHLRL
eukprot:scaffold4939_cov121-Isochrysis_galbana.AAC.2